MVKEMTWCTNVNYGEYVSESSNCEAPIHNWLFYMFGLKMGQDYFYRLRKEYSCRTVILISIILNHMFFSTFQKYHCLAIKIHEHNMERITHNDPYYSATTLQKVLT